MITDKCLMFAETQAGPTTANTAVLGLMTIPTGGLVRLEEPFTVYVDVDVKYEGAGGTAVFSVIGSDAEDGTGNVVELATSGTIALASLVAGARVWEAKLPRKITKAFLAIKAMPHASNAFTAGSFTAGITDKIPLRA